MSPPPYHIHLTERKRLSARLLLFHATEDRWLPIAREDGTSQMEDLVHEGEQLTGASLADSGDNTEPLDQYVRRLGARLRSRVTPPSRSGIPSHILPVLDAFDARAEGLRCHHCADTPCDGNTADDDQRVAHDGRCIEPLVAMFQFALGEALKLYQNHSTLFDPTLHPSVLLSTKSADLAHDAPCVHQVGGSTSYPPHAHGECSNVCLHLCLDKFDRGTLLAGLYPLFHECVVHVYQDLVAPAGAPPREPTGPDDAFSEGWMDWLAMCAMEQALASTDPATNLGVLPARPDEHLNFGRSLHTALHDYRSPMASAQAKQRGQGRAAGRRLLGLFQVWGRLTDCIVAPEAILNDPMGAILAFSLDLNLTRGIHRGRENLVVTVCRDLPSALESPSTFDIGMIRPGQVRALSDFSKRLRLYLDSKELAVLLD